MKSDKSTVVTGDVRPVDDDGASTDDVGRRHTFPRVALALLLGVGALAIGWLVVTGLLARRELNRVADDLAQMRSALKSGDMAQVRSLAGDVRDHAATAHAYLTGPAWWTAAQLPWVGRPAGTARALTTAADDLGTSTLPDIVRLTTSLSDVRDGPAIDLSVLRRAGSAAGRALQSLNAVSTTVAHLSRSWFSPVNSAQAGFTREVDGASSYLDVADRAIRLAVPMLGGDGVRRYFIGFMNEAESRGLGGLPGAFAILTADNGHVSFSFFGTDNAFNGLRAHVALAKDYQARYGNADPLGVYVNSTIGPDFRDAARIWASLWQERSGQHIDGAVAVDPTALKYILRVTGPASSGDITVTADTVVGLTQRDQYSTFPTKGERKRFIVTVARAVVARIMSTGSDVPALLHSIARSAGERRLMVWSAAPSEEAALADSSIGGVLDAREGAFTGFTTVNATGSKLDYYLHRDISYVRSDCNGRVSSTAQLRLDNRAPTHGLPAYVTIRADHPVHPTVPGDDSVIVSYFATPGSTVESVSINGRSVPVSLGTERGLTTVSLLVELPVQQTRTILITLREPRVPGSITSLVQPAVHPATVAVHTMGCQ